MLPVWEAEGDKPNLDACSTTTMYPGFHIQQVDEKRLKAALALTTLDSDPER